MAVKNPELVPLFEATKKLLEPFSKHFTVRIDEPGRYELWSEKDGIVLNGRPRKDIHFAALIIQKHYVGFYFMPIYAETELASFFGPELLATLKGKSCFYIKKLTPQIAEQISDALAKGLQLYRERGWV